MTRYTKKKKPYEIDRTTRIINLRVKKKLNKTRLGMCGFHAVLLTLIVYHINHILK